MQFPCITLLPIFGYLKSFTLILSLFVMVMATLPCCLFDNCPGDKEQKELANGEHEEHTSGDEDGCGTCSPFFACSSCSVAIDQHKPFEHKWSVFVEIPSNDRFSQWENKFNSSFFHSFWQPPKLG